MASRLLLAMVLVFHLIAFVLAVAAEQRGTKPLCHDDESLALLQFKESLMINCSVSYDRSAYSKVSSWEREGNDCCGWDGVKCDENTGHVVSLDLSSSCLFGLINSNNSLFQLVHLHNLNLFDNDFNDSLIPTGFKHLSRLTNLDLSFAGFFGQIPLEILELSNLLSLNLWGYGLELLEPGLTSVAQNLTNLKALDLSDVNMSSTIPKTLANLSSLSSLFLGFCGLYGEFPIEIFHLPNLQILDVCLNENLTGSLPEFNKSSSLEKLALYGTSFSGMLPHSIVNLKSLSYFFAFNCNFSGPIPSSLGNLTQLIKLNLGKNRLHGSIPESISRLVNLVSFKLDRNYLNGTLEFDLFLKLKNLTSLALDENNFSLLTKPSTNTTYPKFKLFSVNWCHLGEFPDFLRNQDKLEVLHLAGTNIHGQVPKWVWDVSKDVIWSLDLSDNSLTGFDGLPFFSPNSNLQILRLDENMLEGSLPIPPRSILWYSAPGNKLTGELSHSICNLSSIMLLDLSNNNLSSSLPQCLGNLSGSLSVLNLHGNNFHGILPQAFAKGNELKMIDLSQNQLQGSIPRSLVNCTKLEVLNLGDNQINDSFPFWLGSLLELKILILRSNRLYGAIGTPSINFAFSSLHVIDLSNNDITGDLPLQYFETWKAMQIHNETSLTYMQIIVYDGFICYYAYSMTFINKGNDMVYDAILDFFMAIDFSNNRFEGEIPKVMGHLKGLKLLNLSNNFLSGHIPSSLGNLTELESLDLSQNKLSGMIPLQLVQLTFLAFLNVSNNYLTGLIPSGKQFDTFPNTSFYDNPELCGSPLSKKCKNFKDPHSLALSFGDNQNWKSLFEFSWKVVAMGYRCGFVVGLVLGITKKHNWFMKTFAMGQPT